MERPTPEPVADPVAELADTFEAASIPYAFTGAVALAFWGIRRATDDVDVVVYGGRVRFAAALNELAARGFRVDPVAAMREATAEGHTVFEATIAAGTASAPIAVDLILPQLQAQARRELGRAVRVPWYSRAAGIAVISAEDLVVHKLIFFRRTVYSDDLRDIESILVRQPTLDIGYVMLSMRDLFPDSDERVRWFREAASRHGLRGNPPRPKRKRAKPG